MRSPTEICRVSCLYTVLLPICQCEVMCQFQVLRPEFHMHFKGKRVVRILHLQLPQTLLLPYGATYS